MNLYEPCDWRRVTDAASNPSIAPTGEIFRDRFHEDVGRLVHSHSYRRLARKRQLLPYENSDFVRTRLTHSCEVAQVSTSLGAWLNSQPEMLKRRLKVNADILVFAGLAHDLGHPPFGHLGERTLNERMWDAGGFEGNAQTLRILTRLERRFTKGQLDEDDSIVSADSFGINTTFRSLASILKYDSEIPEHLPAKIPLRRQADLIKGYYKQDAKSVARMKEALFEGRRQYIEKTEKYGFKTIEAQIMDYSDDIAYSIYDLEDCFRTGVLSPIDFLAAETDLLQTIGAEMAYKVTVDQFKRLSRTDSLDHSKPTKFGMPGEDIDEFESSEEFRKRKKFNERRLSPEFLSKLVYQIFKSIFPETDNSAAASSPKARLSNLSAPMLKRLEAFQKDDVVRRKFTEQFIGNSIRSFGIKINNQIPMMSTIEIRGYEYLQIEFLKRFNFHKVINSDLIQSADSRNAQMVRDVFEALYLPGDEFKDKAADISGYPLLSSNFRLQVDEVYKRHPGQCNVLLENFDRYRRAQPTENATLPSYYRLDYMLGFRNFAFRFELSEAIHRFIRLTDAHDDPSYVAASGRRLEIKRMICDFIANLTDRGLVDIHDRIHKEDRRVVIDDHMS